MDKAIINAVFPPTMRQILSILLAWCLTSSLATSAVRAQNKPLVSAGDFTKIYDPSVGENAQWYINDHCFVRGKDGVWHMFGITHAEPAKPLDEKQFAHATASSLTQASWQKLPFALSADAARQETILWAPYVIFHNNIYYMFYVAGGSDNTKYKIHLATSADLKTWTRHPKNPMVVDGFDARDPFILRVKDRFYRPDGRNFWRTHRVAVCRASRRLLLPVHRTAGRLCRHRYFPKQEPIALESGRQGGPYQLSCRGSSARRERSLVREPLRLGTRRLVFSSPDMERRPERFRNVAANSKVNAPSLEQHSQGEPVWFMSYNLEAGNNANP
ncbi:MAG: hypothetical protein LC770_14470 [Acidobacteria bacterium]|nr:hypothetical protein [Acidobacteriota bacterium]